MIKTQTTFIAALIFLLTFTGSKAWSQELDKNLILGKWKFVKATTSPGEKAYQYNGEPLLTFHKNGTWITDDTNPKYRQSGSWKIENKTLVRDPTISAMGDIGPYPREIEKLTNTELVLAAVTPEGFKTITFYFAKIE